jgi:hypothetical protein
MPVSEWDFKPVNVQPGRTPMHSKCRMSRSSAKVPCPPGNPRYQSMPRFHVCTLFCQFDRISSMREGPSILPTLLSAGWLDLDARAK